jgi:Tfp pilus assembly protein FimT
VKDLIPTRIAPSCAGFTASNLLVTLAIAGVLLAATVPAVSTTLRTYHRNGAAREVLAEIRRTQALAIARRGVFGFQWGADPAVQLDPDQYRLVRDSTGSCGLPASSAPVDDQNVIQGWTRLSATFSGMRILTIVDSANKSLSGVMFDSLGTSVNTCTSIGFPLRVTVGDGSGETRTIEIGRAGATRML